MSPTAERHADDYVRQLAQIVLSESSLAQVLARVAELAVQTVTGVVSASVTLLTKARPATVAYAGDLAMILDEAQYAHGHGPCMDAATGGETMEIADARSETRWPSYVRLALGQGSLSSLSVPLPIQEDSLAALNLYAMEANAFSEDDRTAARSFAAYAAVAVTNAQSYDSTKRLASQLGDAIVSRAVIDQAKGILISQRGVSASEAFDVLVHLSQTSNRKLREVAQELVRYTSSGAGQDEPMAAED